MIKALFKYNIKNNLFIWSLLNVIFIFYCSIIIAMFDPESMKALDEVLKMLPESLVKAMGFSGFGTTLYSFISSYMYGFLIFFFPMICSIIINHRLVAVFTDKGSMAYLLASSNSRIKIIVNQMLFSLISMTIMFVLFTSISILIMTIMFPNQLDIGSFILLNINSLVLYYAIGGIGFFASTIANDTNTSLGIGVSIPVMFLVMQMLGNADDKLKFFHSLSLFSLLKPDAILNDMPFVIISLIVLLLISTILYGLSIYIFNRKNLYI